MEDLIHKEEAEVKSAGEETGTEWERLIEVLQSKKQFSPALCRNVADHLVTDEKMGWMADYVLWYEKYYDCLPADKEIWFELEIIRDSKPKSGVKLTGCDNVEFLLKYAKRSPPEFHSFVIRYLETDEKMQLFLMRSSGLRAGKVGRQRMLNSTDYW